MITDQLKKVRKEGDELRDNIQNAMAEILYELCIRAMEIVDIAGDKVSSYNQLLANGRVIVVNDYLVITKSGVFVKSFKSLRLVKKSKDMGLTEEGALEYLGYLTQRVQSSIDGNKKANEKMKKKLWKLQTVLNLLEMAEI